jgi:hypothetical protein
MTKQDAEKDIRAFIAEFSASLQKPDSLILKPFHTTQSNESILLAIRVLQNNGSSFMHCTPGFENATISFEEDGVKVLVPITLDAALDQTTDQRISDIIFWLQRKNGELVIEKFEGEHFYKEYISLRNSVEFDANQNRLLVDRTVHYENALELQKKYDSVIWYTQYKNKSYYYVVKGMWINYFLDRENLKPCVDCNMGLVDEKGNEIIPLEFDLIGTPGFVSEDIIEVKKNDRVGYFNLREGRLLVPTDYEWIMPYSSSFEFALVKKDSLHGWLDHDYQFHEGFLNEEARQYLRNYKFLPQELTLDETHQSLCEIPTAEYAAYGILLPPSYLTSFGILSEVVAGFTVGDVYNRSYLQYLETRNSFIENITETISAVMSIFKSRYLDGREEFYMQRQITFVNGNRETVGVQELDGQGTISFKKLDSTLLEMKLVQSVDEVNGDFGDDENEWNPPYYTYFQIGKDNSITLLNSNRRFDFTEMVKMDSSYLSGNFIRYNFEMNDREYSNFLSSETLIFMRNEILASYGYTFSDPSHSDAFQYAKWYQPQYSTYGEFMGAMTEIDKHNLLFLESMVGTLDVSFSASL